jgi:hypothetical protein
MFGLTVAVSCYAEGQYAEGHSACTPRAAKGQRASAEGRLRQGDTPRAALGVSYADGNAAYVEGRKPSATGWIPVVQRKIFIAVPMITTN